jgi:hypothetical protein
MRIVNSGRYPERLIKVLELDCGGGRLITTSGWRGSYVTFRSFVF